MKNEITAYMQSAAIDVLWVKGDAFHNATMVYLTGGGHVTNADLIYTRTGSGTIFCNDMEREEAAKTGFTVRTLSQYPLSAYTQASGGDPSLAAALRYQKMFSDAGITSGKIALYGMNEIGPVYGVYQHLARIMPEIELVGFYDDPILMPAMMSKDENEIERIRRMGKITTEVVARVADFLTHRPVKNEILIDRDDQPVTIARVKSLIDLWLAELGAENPEGAIFAIGRDAGVPHSSGNPADLLQLGKTIVFDIFPCEVGGGYFYDFTRTWSLGYATDETQALFDQVFSVYQQVTAALTINRPFKDYQKMTCDLFEALGHPTIQSTPGTQEGYVHSVGHGVGLRIHEMPFSGSASSNRDLLVPGSVIAVEPGLYYPSKGMGFRVENTFYAQPDGQFIPLVEYPTDFVLPMKK